MSKFGNVKFRGHDSKKEARRAQELWLLQRAGKISNLREQVAFEVLPTQYYPDGKVKHRAVKYVADFVYELGGETIVEDVKGYKTPEYRIKKKLLSYFYGLDILET